MPEILLHTIWLRGLFRDFPQQTTDGLPVEVIDPGQHNLDSGPDFSAAILRIGNLQLAGNVEIHVSSSDWNRHGHQTDPAYDSVILHVVRTADREVFNSRGERIPQLELRYPSDPAFLEGLIASHSWLCSQQWNTASEGYGSWRSALLEDRILKKTTAIRQLLQLSCNHWEQAFYITLAHNFGFHTNSLPFELMAKQTPMQYLLKHRSSLFQLQAMLLGQAGLLEEPYISRIGSQAPQASQAFPLEGQGIPSAETTPCPFRGKGQGKGAGQPGLGALQSEYRFLQKKFSLVPIDGSLWKYGRMRPQNFPHVRIMQFAALIHEHDNLLSEVLSLSDVKQLRAFFIDATRAGGSVPPLGRSAADVLIINSAVPYKYAWGRTHAKPSLMEEASALLDKLPAETNHILDQWKELGVLIRTAADSQAFIHLYQEYCLRQRCLSCDLGIAFESSQNGEKLN